MTTPLFVLSYVVLWALVLLLGVALFLLYSHVGGRFLSSREGQQLQGPDLNVRVEPKVVTSIAGVRIALGAPSMTPRLVLYTSVRCAPCRELFKALPDFNSRFGSEIETIVVCHGEDREVRALASDMASPVVVCPDPRGEITSAFGVLVTPYALAIDKDGFLRSKGVPGTDPSSLSLFLAQWKRPGDEGSSRTLVNGQVSAEEPLTLQLAEGT